MTKKHGRHTPAFLLLLLSERPAYGALLLSRLQSELPFCPWDSAIVYRSLKQMEGQGFVEARWVTKGSDRPRKWYTVTPLGNDALAAYAEDIRLRVSNLRFFLDRYRLVRSGEQA